jgi:hypothetical protein
LLGNGTRVGTTNAFTLSGLNLPTGQNLWIRARGFYRGGYHTASESSPESVQNVVFKGYAALSDQASATVPLGGALSDTATVSGVNPIGAITFSLFPMDNFGRCIGSPIFTSTKPVNGNGSYTSDSFTPSARGVYQWIASYSGDGYNNGAATSCGNTNGQVAVTKGTPTLATQASANVSLGGTISDTATVSGAYGPTGTVSFSLYGPGDATCGTWISLTYVSLDSNGRATSPDFTPTTPGTYRWVASYGGDANYNGVTGACNDPTESVVVSKAVPIVATQASAAIFLGRDLRLSNGFRGESYRHRHLQSLWARQRHLRRDPDLH